MQSSPFNPLDRNHIQVAPSQKEKRQQRFYRTYPWYFATIWAVVVSGFFWSEIFHPEPPLPPIPPCVPEGSHRYVTPPEKVRPLIEPIPNIEPFVRNGCILPTMHTPLDQAPLVVGESSKDEELLFPSDYDWDEIPDEIEVVASPTDSKIPDFSNLQFHWEEPKPLNMPEVHEAIGYPQIARDAGIEGQVVVRILVDEHGIYVKHMVINQVHPILTKAVEKHISLLRFEPAIQDGSPTRFWVSIPFTFKTIN